MVLRLIREYIMEVKNLSTLRNRLRKGVVFAALLFAFLPLTSCSVKTNYEKDIVICYLSNARVNVDLAEPWSVFADIVYRDGTQDTNRVGEYLGNKTNLYTSDELKGRFFAFQSDKTIEGAIFGLGYFDKDRIPRIPARSYLSSYNHAKLFCLSVSPNGYLYEADSKWSNVHLSVTDFVGLIFSNFDVEQMDGLGYMYYPIINDVFVKYVDDFSMEQAKEVNWIKNDVTHNLYSDLITMKKNYNSNKKNNKYIALLVICWIFGISIFIGVGTLVFLYFKKWKKKHDSKEII